MKKSQNREPHEVIDFDSDHISLIAPDVMKVLSSRKFFEKLDSLLCPEKTSPKAEKCSGDFKLSKSLVLEAKFSDQDISDIFSVLRSRGGFCDCEILYNVAESSRLKSEYWRSRATEGSKGQERHHQ
jgi:hypothetical protein